MPAVTGDCTWLAMRTEPELALWLLLAICLALDWYGWGTAELGEEMMKVFNNVLQLVQVAMVILVITVMTVLCVGIHMRVSDCIRTHTCI